MSDKIYKNKKYLIVIEAFGKIKQMEKITNELGYKCEVIATSGHIKGLNPRKMGIDMNTFEGEYVVLYGKNKIINNLLKKRLTYKNNIIVATDMDNEGEMIGYNVAEALKIDPAKIHRLVFHSITKNDIKKGLENISKIDMNVVEAQKSRAMLDKIMGYTLSPLVIKNNIGISSGRVQSVIVKLVYDKEKEIDEFMNNLESSYYNISSDFVLGDLKKFNNSALMLKNKICKINSKSNVEDLLNEFNENKNNFYIDKITQQICQRNPPPPFETSTILSVSNSVLNFSLKRTTTAAQKLYMKGYITYIRTDLTTVPPYDQEKIKNYIDKVYPELSQKRLWGKPSKKNVQGAHPGIIIKNPKILKDDINGTSDEKRLYDLIWKRTIASQMVPAKFNKYTINITWENKSNKDYCFQNNIEECIFPGYLTVYGGTIENINIETDWENNNIKYTTINATGKYNKCPTRYNERSMTNKMKSLGIGRPSTYSSLITKITDKKRNYVVCNSSDGITKQTVNYSLNFVENNFKTIG